MIIKEVKVTLYKPKVEIYEESRGWFFIFGNLVDDSEKAIGQMIGDKVADDYNEVTYTFSKFTSKGKLSKSDKFYREELIPFAEKAFAKLVQTEQDTESDMARALELKEIINNADFNGKLVSIKHRISKSKWYEGNGVGNMRSQYDTLVPASILDEALELQAIRKKHQGNDLFDFYGTNYKTITKRVADHDNLK